MQSARISYRVSSRIFAWENDMKMNLPSYIAFALSRLETAGYEAFVVGGAVRDTLLGKTPWDYDIATSATPDEMLKVFSALEYYTTGLKHGTLSVIIEHRAVEITTYRIDGTYTDTRHPDAVTFTTRLEADLGRRDFTVNAMAYSHRTGLVDLFDGQKDLACGIIRTVGEPNLRFTEDALRILRAFRFAAKLGFTLDEPTLGGIRHCRHGLQSIAAERISHELCGILEGQNAYESLCLMQQSGVLSLVAAPFAKGLDQGLSSLPKAFAVRAAFLLRFSSEQETADLLHRLRLSNAVTHKIRSFLSLLPRTQAAMDDYPLRRLMADAGEGWEDLLSLAEAAGQDMTKTRAQATLFRTRGDCLCLSDLAVNGKMLIEHGLSGKAVGDALQCLWEVVLHTPEVNRADILLGLLDKSTF